MRCPGHWEYFQTGEEAKGLDNRYCVKFMQFRIGLSIVVLLAIKKKMNTGELISVL